MTAVLERLILNPVEFVPGLPEIDLEDLGLTVAAEPGPDYGESSATVERVRQDISEGATDSRWPPVECTIPIIARGSQDLAIADPLHRLEGWVADVQRRRSAWVRRDFSTDGGFAGSVGAFVDSAALTPAQGWSFAHMQFAPGIALKFTRYPIWFATVEVDEDAEGNPLEVTGSGVRDLQLELADLLGTAPGLITVRITNEGTEDWRGCYVSLECDDFSAAPTAKPSYEARELTLQGNSTSTEVSGAKVVKCPPLTAGWVTVLGSEIAALGEEMTHVGPRRMIFRIDDVSTVLGDVQWKLEWRTLGAATWNQTMVTSTPLIVSSPVVGAYQLLDLGEARPEVPVTGDPRFQWRLQGRSLSGSGKQPLIRDVYPMSTEQWMRVADTSETPIDGEQTLAPQTVVDASGTGSVEWQVPVGGDFTVEYAKLVFSGEGESHFLKATNFGFAIPTGARILGITATVSRFTEEGKTVDGHVRIVKAGAIKTAVDNAHQNAAWPVYLTPTSYGGIGDLWGQTWAPSDINSSEFGIALSVSVKNVPAGTHKTGVDAITLAVAYSEGANENRVCFASRSIEFADTGVRRQHFSDEVWGDIPAPEGMLLKAPAPGQAGQDARLLIVPSVGDLATRADAASVEAAAKVSYRPGYLFAREAA